MLGCGRAMLLVTEIKARQVASGSEPMSDVRENFTRIYIFSMMSR